MVGEDALTQALAYQFGIALVDGAQDMSVRSEMPLPAQFRPDQLDPISRWAWTSLLREAGGDAWQQWAHLVGEFHQQQIQSQEMDDGRPVTWLRSQTWQGSHQADHLATLSYALIMSGL